MKQHAKEKRLIARIKGFERIPEEKGKVVHSGEYHKPGSKRR